LQLKPEQSKSLKASVGSTVDCFQPRVNLSRPTWASVRLVVGIVPAVHVAAPTEPAGEVASLPHGVVPAPILLHPALLLCLLVAAQVEIVSEA